MEPCVRDSASYFMRTGAFNSQNNTVKRHCYKLPFTDEDIESRVAMSLHFQGHISSICRSWN